MAGLVSLVGAGPGDPELLTVKGAHRLAEADLVLYDALVSPAALDLAPRAQRFLVGKRAGRPSPAQATINRLMIKHAARGRRLWHGEYACPRGTELVSFAIVAFDA